MENKHADARVKRVKKKRSKENCKETVEYPPCLKKIYTPENQNMAKIFCVDAINRTLQYLYAFRIPFHYQISLVILRTVCQVINSCDVCSERIWYLVNK